jgi:hypothetical protein
MKQRIRARTRARAVKVREWLSKRDGDAWAFVAGAGLSYEGAHHIYAPAADLGLGLAICALRGLDCSVRRAACLQRQESHGCQFVHAAAGVPGDQPPGRRHRLHAAGGLPAHGLPAQGGAPETSRPWELLHDKSNELQAASETVRSWSRTLLVGQRVPVEGARAGRPHREPLAHLSAPRPGGARRRQARVPRGDVGGHAAGLPVLNYASTVVTDDRRFSTFAGSARTALSASRRFSRRARRSAR